MKTDGRGYKLFRKKGGKLYPLYILSNEEIKVGVWLRAKAGPRTADGKVKGKMTLAYRPGWHIAGTKPEAPQITNQKGCVWCEVEYKTNHNYTPEARENGWRNGRWAAVRADLKKIPVNGFYTYKTSHKQTEPWVICGEMKVVRELSESRTQTKSQCRLICHICCCQMVVHSECAR